MAISIHPTLSSLFVCAVWTLNTSLSAADIQKPGTKPRIGFTTTLSGDGAVSGEEMKNAVLLANEMIANNAFDIIFEDEKCLGAPAAAAAHKFVNINKIDYAMGFFCNVSLLTALPIYVKSHVPVLSSCATTMDKPDVGNDVFRLFPADQLSIPVLYSYAAKKFQKVGVLAEEDAYAQMLSKEFERINLQSATPLKVVVEDYPFEAVDFRTQLLKLKTAGIDALFISSATEPSFIRIVRQMHELGIKPEIIGVYTPVSDVAIKELGSLLDGAVAVTLPILQERSSNPEAARMMQEYSRRFGEPKSAFPVVPTTFEATRLVYEATHSKRTIGEVVRDPNVLANSLIGPYQFDKFGALQDVRFVLKKVNHLQINDLD